MSEPPHYFVLTDGKARGPFDISQVQQLLDSGALARDSPASVAVEGPFVTLRDLAPPGLSFERALSFNVANRRTGTAIDHRDLIAAANLAPRRGAVTPPAPPRPVPQAPGTPGPDALATNVSAMLKFNNERQRAAGADELIPMPKRKSRRRRDFYFLALVGLAFDALFVVKVTPLNVMWGASLYAFFIIGIYWVMYIVMDDY